MFLDKVLPPTSAQREQLNTLLAEKGQASWGRLRTFETGRPNEDRYIANVFDGYVATPMDHLRFYLTGQPTFSRRKVYFHLDEYPTDPTVLRAPTHRSYSRYAAQRVLDAGKKVALPLAA